MRKILCILFLFFACQGSVRSQLIDSVLAKTATAYQNEKVYLHYDKSSYYNGETIWFKGYVMEGIYPALTSKTLYVDWIAEDGKVLSHTVSPMIDGMTNGQFEIPADYSDDFIHVRAYTKWMLNFDTAFLYSKDIRIHPKEKIPQKAPAAIVPVIQFFPEGGDLVSGITNTVAFKANDQYGRPVSISGRLIDNKGATVSSFRSLHDGMGSFSFVPQPGISYSVKWTDEKKMERTTQLPQINSSGVSMQVLVEGKSRVIYINGSKQSDASLQQLHLVGTMNGGMAFKTDISLAQTNPAKRIIPTGNLVSGVLTLTLFDANWKALAERVTFVNNNDYVFQTEMDVQRWGLGKRKRNEIEITVPADLQETSLSISVTDASIGRDTTDHIISNLLLSSEIKGKVFNPAYYFSNTSDSVARHLDLIMMTHGWRRFNWEDMVKGKLPEINYPRDSVYLTLSGKVFGVARSQLTGTEHIALLTKQDSTSKMFIMNIDKDGSFGDPDLVLFDTLSVYYSLKSKFMQSAQARFMLDRLPAPNYSPFAKNFNWTNKLYDTTGSSYHRLLGGKELELRNMERGRVLQTVIIQTTKKPPVQVLEEKYTSGLFKGGDGYQFDLVNDITGTSFRDVFTYLQGRVAGLQINSTSTPPSLVWRGDAPIVFLDEIQTDVSMLANVPLSDIAYVKVFRPPFMGGSGGAGGAISVYTKKGSDRTVSSGGGLSSNTVIGYSPIKQFYSPNYDSFDPKNERQDVRTTLYWNPLVTTSQGKNKVKLVFYNNDVTKAFRVVIEGMSKEGLLTHYETLME